MNVFTFDDIYFFERPSQEDDWYAYTHPRLESFAHGRFDVVSCKYSRDPVDGRGFSESQIREVEEILLSNISQMDIHQFKVHSVLPHHHRAIGFNSRKHSDFAKRLKWLGRTEPTFSVAFESLVQKNPAYRLTRAFLQDVFAQMEHVTSDEVDEWLHVVARHTWTYDCGSPQTESYDEFFQRQREQLTVPDPTRLKLTAQDTLYEIVDLPRLYLLQRDRKSGCESKYYVDTGSVISPTPLPPQQYIV